MKTIFRWCIFLLVLFGVGSVVYADTPVSWEDSTQVNYNTSFPGTILNSYDPLSQGGMNLSTGEMTKSTDADIVFSSDGKEMGASGIYDLGNGSLDDFGDIPNSGYSKTVSAVPEHVYSVKLADGSIVKLRIVRNLGSSVSIEYAFGESLQQLPDGTQVTYDTFIPGTSLLFSDPTLYGGLNFLDGVMTDNADETDIAISYDEIGSRAIKDLGEVDMNDVGYDSIPSSGFSQITSLLPDHVYITATHDGEFAKFYVAGVYASTVEIVYQIMAPELTSIDLIGPSSIGTSPVTLTVKGNYNDDTTEVIPNEDVIWESSDETVGTISDSGVLQLTGKTGKVTITATYGDLEDSITYSVRTLNSIKINQSLKYSSSPVTLTVTGMFSDNTSSLIKTAVTWKSNNTNVATVDSKGVVTFTGNSGTVTITATYNGKTASVTCKVVDFLKSISTTTKLSYSDKPVTINLTAVYTNGKKQTIKSGVVWKSSNTNVAKVNSSGVVTFTGKDGSVTITATYQGKSTSLTCTVKDVLKTITPTTKLAYSKKPVAMHLTATYTNGKKLTIKSGVTWKSSNTNVAKVNSSGVVTFTGKSGEVTITATYKGKTAAMSCTVGNVVKSLSTSTKFAYSKKPITINLVAKYSNGKKVLIKKGVVWKSSNTKVAKVSSSGVVTFTGENGDVTITGTYQGKTITLKTTVYLKENEVKFFTSKTWKLYMDYVELDVGTLKFNSNGTYTWNKPYGIVVTGKWSVSQNNTIYLYNFGYNLDLTYEMYRDSDTGNVYLVYNHGETGSDFYTAK